MTKKVIITGATSGIGYELALKLANKGYQVLGTGRREDRLRMLQSENPEQLTTMQWDVTDLDNLQSNFDKAVQSLGGLDLCVVNSGIGRQNPDLQFQPELETINVNVCGFTATLLAAARYFLSQGRGHIVGISSVAAHKGFAGTPAYNASKSYEKTYMEGIYCRLQNTDVTITDIRPGFIYTEMTEENKNMFWVATAERAAKDIYKAIKKKKRVAYITPRWRIMSWIMRGIPLPLFAKFSPQEK